MAAPSNRLHLWMHNISSKGTGRLQHTGKYCAAALQVCHDYQVSAYIRNQGRFVLDIVLVVHAGMFPAYDVTEGSM
jgi:hypothetical protein